MRISDVVRVIGRPVLAWFALMVASAIIFSIFSGFGFACIKSTNQTVDSLRFDDFLYFVFVTTTTVGYGDYVPIGVFRFISIVDALSGIILGGVVVSRLTAEMLDPFGRAKELKGFWFDRVAIRKDDGSEHVFFSVFEIKKTASGWVCNGSNYSENVTPIHSYKASLVAIDDNEFMFRYKNTEDSRDDYTGGLWVMEIPSTSGEDIWYSGWSIDEEYGRRDSSRGFRLHRVEDSEILAGFRCHFFSEKFKTAFSKARAKIRDLEDVAHSGSP